jgi:hypothetical protein
MWRRVRGGLDDRDLGIMFGLVLEAPALGVLLLKFSAVLLFAGNAILLLLGEGFGGCAVARRVSAFTAFETAFGLAKQSAVSRLSTAVAVAMGTFFGIHIIAVRCEMVRAPADTTVLSLVQTRRPSRWSVDRWSWSVARGD